MRRERSQTLKGFLTVLQKKGLLPVRVQVSHRIFSQASILRHEESKPELAKKGEGWIIPIHLDDFRGAGKTISSWSLAHCCFAGGHPDTSVGQGAYTHPHSRHPL